MVKKILFILLSILSFNSFSQLICPINTDLTKPWEWPAHSNWYFGDGNIHNFNTGVTLLDNTKNSYEGVSSVSDDQGNLLFYTNGRNLWDKNGNLTTNSLLEGNEGGGTGDVGSASQGVITIRHPFAPDDYYVLTTDDALGGTLGLNYVVIGKDGQLKSGPTRLGSFRTTEGIAATLHRNGLDVWVTVQASGTTNYYTYLLTCSGFDPNPVISNVAPPDVSGNKERGGLAFSPDGTKFAQGHPDYWPNSDKELTLYDFNNLTGEITNPINISPNGSGQNPYDLVFSTDGQTIYFTEGGTGIVYSVDISSGDKTTMTNSTTNTGYGGGGFSAIEIGPDGKIYTAGGSLTSMSGDNLGNADLGLPTMYIPPSDSVEIQHIGVVSLCDLPLNLSTLWYCKGSDAENTPRYENAYTMELSSGSHTLDPITGVFNTNTIGTYRVRFQICDIWDTLTFNIIDCNTCNLDLKDDVEICLGETLLLDTMFVSRSSSGNWSIDSIPSLDGDGAILQKGTDTIFDASSLSTKPGTYKLLYTINDDGNICKDSIYITVNPLPKPHLGVDTNICFGNSIILDGGDYVDFEWSTNETTKTIEVDSTGDYIVLVTDSNGCLGKDTINLSIIDLPNPSVLVDMSVCPGVSQRFDINGYDNGNGPYTYNWSNNETNYFIDVDSGGYYWVDITDKYGCVGRDSDLLTINENLTPIINGSPLINICDGDSVNLISNYLSVDGYNFSWSNGENTESINVYTSGIYDLHVDNGVGCKGDTSIEVIVNPLPLVSDSITGICDGDSVIFGDNVNENVTYLWSSGETTYNLNISESGIYKRIVTTLMGCKDSSNFTLVVNPLPVVDLGDDVEVCVGTDFIINSNLDDVKYLWSTGDTTYGISPNINGEYSLTVVDSNGCSDIDTINVVYNPLPIVDLGDDVVICEGETIDINSNSNLNVKWDNGDTTSVIKVSESGDYSVIVSDGICEGYDTINVSVVDLPISELDKSLGDKIICFDDYERGIDLISNVSDSYDYLWNNGYTTNMINIIDGGLYSVSINNNGCGIKDSVLIKTYCPFKFFVPNSFTPNGDGLNDIFYAYGDNIVDFKLLIFDRWGVQIFETNDINIGWDGKYKNEYVQIDVYVWKAYYSVNDESNNIEKYQKVGIVSLIR